MKIQEANNLFKNLKIEATAKSEVKIYEKFLHILSGLKNREFTADEIQSIETKLDSLRLASSPVNRKKHFKKSLREFQNFLKEKHALITPGYYTTMGIGLGVTFGVVVGILIGERLERSLGISLGISLGMLIGAIVGRYLDSRAVAEGKVL